MKDLIAKLPEQYQDIEYEGKLYKGKRDCSLRWDLIRDHIKDGDVVMDLGSSLGYYAHRIAKEYPNSLVVSFESEPEMCAVQKKIFESEGIYNVVVCQHRLSESDLEKWVKHVDCFDTILALSVLHHFPVGDVDSIFINLIKMASSIIGEVPSKKEVQACGGDARLSAAELVPVYGDVIGEVPSHLGMPRKVWRYLEGIVVRSNLESYFGVSHGGRHKFNLQDWCVNCKPMIKGINVWNLLHFNIVWPPPNWWKVQARSAYECLEFKSDIRPWNLLVTSTGLKAIDYTHRYPDGDQAEFNQKHLDRLDALFTKMEPDLKYLRTW